MQFFEKPIRPMFFSNVKNFIVVIENENFVLPTLPFVFAQLDNFTCDDYYQFESDALRLPSDWFKIIPNNRNLKTISMAKTALTTQNLNDYSKRFPNLNSFTFKLSGDLCDDALIQVLKCTQIKTITIAGVPVTTPYDALMNRLSNKWNYRFVPDARSEEVQTLLLKQVLV